MPARDAVLAVAVVLLAGFALADALRREPPARTEAAAERTERPRSPDVYPRVAGARGSLVFTDARHCRLHEVALPSGRTLPQPPLEGNCDLWGPSVGTRVAYGVGARRGAVTFRFADLNHPEEDLGTHRSVGGGIAWSPDGQRAAWCTSRRSGVDLEFYRERRRLPGCPRGYTSDGDVVYARGASAVAEDGTVFAADAFVTQVATGSDGSVALVTETGRVEIWGGRRGRWRVDLPDRLRGRDGVFSPDNCAALFPLPGGRIELADLGCFVGASGAFAGVDAAWSPDGEWLVVAEENALVFMSLGRGPAEIVRWPVEAKALAWLD